jgi:hypothetical protein
MFAAVYFTFAVAVQNIAWDWSQVPIGAIVALSVPASHWLQARGDFRRRARRHHRRRRRAGGRPRKSASIARRCWISTRTSPAKRAMPFCQKCSALVSKLSRAGVQRRATRTSAKHTRAEWPAPGILRRCFDGTGPQACLSSNLRSDARPGLPGLQDLAIRLPRSRKRAPNAISVVVGGSGMRVAAVPVTAKFIATSKSIGGTGGLTPIM